MSTFRDGIDCGGMDYKQSDFTIEEANNTPLAHFSLRAVVPIIEDTGRMDWNGRQRIHGRIFRGF